MSDFDRLLAIAEENQVDWGRLSGLVEDTSRAEAQFAQESVRAQLRYLLASRVPPEEVEARLSGRMLTAGRFGLELRRIVSTYKPASGVIVIFWFRVLSAETESGTTRPGDLIPYTSPVGANWANAIVELTALFRAVSDGSGGDGAPNVRLLEDALDRTTKRASVYRARPEIRDTPADPYRNFDLALNGDAPLRVRVDVTRKEARSSDMWFLARVWSPYLYEETAAPKESA